MATSTSELLPHKPHLLGLPLEAVADVLDHILLQSHRITFDDNRYVVDRKEWPIDFLYTCRFLYGAGVDAIRRAFAEHTTLVFVNCVPTTSKFRFSEKLLRHLNKQERMLHLFTHSYMPFFTRVEMIDTPSPNFRPPRPDVLLKDLELVTAGPMLIGAHSNHFSSPIRLYNMNDRGLNAWVNKAWERSREERAKFWSICSMFCKPTPGVVKTQRKFRVLAKLNLVDGQGTTHWEFTWDPDAKRILDKKWLKKPIQS